MAALQLPRLKAVVGALKACGIAYDAVLQVGWGALLLLLLLLLCSSCRCCWRQTAGDGGGC